MSPQIDTGSASTPHKLDSRHEMAFNEGKEVINVGDLEVAAFQYQQGHSTYAPGHNDAREKGLPDRPSRRICGLRKRIFCVIATVVVILVVVGLIVGLVAALAMKNSRNNSSGDSTPTVSGPAAPDSTAPAQSIPSATTSTPAIALQTITSNSKSIIRDCPSSNGTTYTSGTDPPQTFQKHCSSIFGYDTGMDDGPFDTLASSLEGCINLCAAYNAFNASGPAGPCYSVGWRHDERYDQWGHCWGAWRPANGAEMEIRNATTKPGDDIPLDSAILVSDESDG